MMQYIPKEGGRWRPLRHPVSETKVRNFCWLFTRMLNKMKREGKIYNPASVRICLKKSWRSVACHAIRFSDGSIYYASIGAMLDSKQNHAIMRGIAGMVA